MNNSGQSILSEYVMIFFVVMAALTAMTTFVQRGLQARVHDARNYMVDAVMNTAVCDTNCLAATGGNIAYEYEPYYAYMDTNVQQYDKENAGATSGRATALGVTYLRSLNQATQSNAYSVQFPPCAGANPMPAWCGQGAVSGATG
jgi:hypothetical protein